MIIVSTLLLFVFVLSLLGCWGQYMLGGKKLSEIHPGLMVFTSLYLILFILTLVF